ncbi:acyl-CoA dehydrogenase family protein [Euzebya sp.]|uniref:acyl-CoA dehydrogenase family protein n=1 Tax=Euzebya sp. TaxID=1971409 RepID=UPI003514C3D1
MIPYGPLEAVDGIRAELRDLVDAHVPADFMGAFTDDPADFEAAQAFCRVLGERRLLTLAWPADMGGRDGTVWEQAALREEMWAAFEPRGAQYMGVNWVGPAIERFGTPAQKAAHLPRIAAGEVVWCQGFSEPEAGSDLASLRTRAVAHGGGWTVHGQKVWTSYAGMADWLFLLARTADEGRKHHGITVFLVPMDRPGIEVRPIPSMLGPHHLNEVFIDGLEVTADDVLGDVHDGWDLVREALAFERVGIARYARCERLLQEAPQVLGLRWSAVPDALRQRWAAALVHTRRARLLAYRVLQGQEDGAADPGQAAAYRIAVTQLDQEVAEVLMDIVGAQGLGADDRFTRAVEDHWRYAQASSVASGTIEMQRLLLARRILGGNGG